MTIDTKILKKFGIIQTLTGIGLMIYGNIITNEYSLLYAGLGCLLILTAIIYYFGN